MAWWWKCFPFILLNVSSNKATLQTTQTFYFTYFFNHRVPAQYPRKIRADWRVKARFPKLIIQSLSSFHVSKISAPPVFYVGFFLFLFLLELMYLVSQDRLFFRHINGSRLVQTGWPLLEAFITHTHCIQQKSFEIKSTNYPLLNIHKRINQIA